jgi:hypothetical protein
LFGVLEIALVFPRLVLPEAAVPNIAFELTWVRRASPGLFAFGAAPARARPDAWPALGIHNVIRIAGAL